MWYVTGLFAHYEVMVRIYRVPQCFVAICAALYARVGIVLDIMSVAA